MRGMRGVRVTEGVRCVLGACAAAHMAPERMPGRLDRKTPTHVHRAHRAPSLAAHFTHAVLMRPNAPRCSPVHFVLALGCGSTQPPYPSAPSPPGPPPHLLINELRGGVGVGLVEGVPVHAEGHQPHLLIHAVHSHLRVGVLGKTHTWEGGLAFIEMVKL